MVESIRSGENQFMSHEQMNRLQAKKAMATMLNFCDSTSASCSVIPSAMKMRVP